jgi:hypothetical protein
MLYVKGDLKKTYHKESLYICWEGKMGEGMVEVGRGEEGEGSTGAQRETGGGWREGRRGGDREVEGI